MCKLDLIFDLDAMIKDIETKEEAGLVVKGSDILRFIKEHTSGKIIDSVNLDAEIERRIAKCTEHNDLFYVGQRYALGDLLMWIKDNI